LYSVETAPESAAADNEKISAEKQPIPIFIFITQPAYG
jgi:hypothetical protein